MEHAVEPKKATAQGFGQPPRSNEPPVEISPFHPVLQLQQEIGNQAVQGLLRSGQIRAKLAISRPDEPEEREADAVADRIMRSPAGMGTAECHCSAGGEMCEECQKKQQGTLARKAAGESPLARSVPPSFAPIEHILRSPGQPLDLSTRAFFELRFGRDLGNVRVHTGTEAAESARAVQANAYTVREHLVFDAARYVPNSDEGKRLLAHELTHTLQQDGSHVAIQRQPKDPQQRGSRPIPHRSAQVNPSFRNTPPPPVAGEPIWPYPAIAAALPREVVELRASASLRVPVRLLLRPDVTFVDHDIWDAFLTNRRAHGSDEDAAELVRNEIMRQYFAGKLSLDDVVEIDVTPPLGPVEPVTVSFWFHGQEVLTPDGMIGPDELSTLGPIEPVVKRVQHDADQVELAGELLDELDELDPAIKQLESVRTEPEDFVLNTVTSIRDRVQQAKEVADDWSCRTGPLPTAASNLISRYNHAWSIAQDAAVFMVHWHDTNTMESAGQANVRRGRSSGLLGWIFWGVVDAGEETLSLGYHGTRTKLSEEYEAGNLSWNDVRDLSNKAARRAILTAAVMGQLGRFAGRFAAGFSRGLGPGYTAAKAGAGAVLGGFSSATTLASQTVLTRFGGGNLSPTAQAIWNAGAPSGKAWAIGVPLGVLTGGLYGARPLPPTTTSAVPTPRPFGIMSRLAVWSRLNFGEPIMRGVSETNIELVGEPTTIPGGSTMGPSIGAPQSPAPGVGFEQPATPAPGTPIAPTPSPFAGAPTGAPNISLGFRPIIVYPPAQTPSAAAAVSAQALANLPNITAAEAQALQRISPAAWNDLLQYATTNRNVFSVKGKIAEALYFSGASAAARRQQAIQVAAGLGIPADAVQFTSNVRGQAPTRTSAGTMGELGDGIFYAVRNGRLYILAIVESKSPSNKAELARKAPGGEREFLGQLAWDFERLREAPVTIEGRVYNPEDVVVSRTFTRFIGVLPQGSSLSQASITAIRSQVRNVDIDTIDVRDGLLNDAARLIISLVSGS